VGSEVDGLVEIRFGAAMNQNARSGGWVAVVTVNGRRITGTWSTLGHDRDAAMRMAEAEARAEAEHYRGDWEIVVTDGETL